MVSCLSTPLESKGVKCARCSEEAVVRVRYAKLNLCRKHFIEYVENRVLNTLKRYKLIEKDSRILIGVSGGKDSLSLLYILSSLKDKVGLREIYAIHIDLGLGAFSAISREAVERACKDTMVKCIFLNLKEIMGFTIPELVKATRRPPCSLCGLVKRYVINAVGLELNVNGAVLGHHMDDILVFALKDLVTCDIESFIKMVPYTPGLQGVAVPRLKALYEIYERDLELYSKLRGIVHVEEPCPFKHHDLLKTKLRQALDDLEDSIPGFKITLTRRLYELAKLISGQLREEIVPCRFCGLPSKTGVCSICKITMRIHGEPRGSVMRERIKGMIESTNLS